MGDGEVIQNHAAFIWSVADLLRGDYKQSEYGKVILPLTVLRRLDCVLEPTKRQVLERINERFGTSFAPEDRVFFDAVAEKLTQEPAIQQAAAVNSPENFGLVLEKAFQDGVIDQLGAAEEMALGYLDNPDLQAEVLATYRPFIQNKATSPTRSTATSPTCSGPTGSRPSSSTRRRCAPTPTAASCSSPWRRRC